MPTKTGAWRDIWLVVARGGWWTGREIWQELGCDCTTQDAHQTLYRLAKNGYVRSRKSATLMYQGQALAEYALTPECRIPHGIEVREFQAALTA